MKDFKPMLSAAAELSKLRYPLLASPKLDGIRAIVLDGVVYSRSMKPIRNKRVQKLFGIPELHGMDGELIVGPPNAEDVYLKTNSGVMSAEGEPDVKFFVFDNCLRGDTGYRVWLRGALSSITVIENVRVVGQLDVRNEEELLTYEQEFLSIGYEGMMLRSVDGHYKQGRSTVKEGYLMKLKRFVDTEAKVVGFVELFHNTNEAKVNELGYQERSSSQEGKVPGGTLGALVCKHPDFELTFEVGTGFTAEMRKQIWDNRFNYTGKLVKFKYFPIGVKERPRLPVFLGFRDEEDT